MTVVKLGARINDPAPVLYAGLDAGDATEGERPYVSTQESVLMTRFINDLSSFQQPVRHSVLTGYQGRNSSADRQSRRDNRPCPIGLNCADSRPNFAVPSPPDGDTHCVRL